LPWPRAAHARVLVRRSAKDAPLWMNEPEPVVGIHRRHALAWASLCVGLPQLPAAAAAAAAAASLEEYRDEADAFTIQVPRGWNFAVPQQPYDRFRCELCSFVLNGTLFSHQWSAKQQYPANMSVGQHFWGVSPIKTANLGHPRRSCR
jgi:hypothetical protein